MSDNELHVWDIREQLLDSRLIKIYSEINDDVAHFVTSALDVLSNDDPSAPIKLEINTPGGSVLAGFAICDKITEIPNPVIAFDTGLCASMGTAITAFCDYAFGSEDCSFMIHEMSTGFKGKFREMENQLKFDKALNQRLMERLAKKCNKSVDQIMHDAIYDHWMTAIEAKEYGLIDAITPKAHKNEKALNEFLKTFNG